MQGIILAIAAACGWSISAILARVALQSGLRSSTGTLISMTSSLLVLGALALTVNFDEVLNLAWMAFLWFGLLGILNYVMGRHFNYISIRRIGVARASPLFSSAPLFAMILAVSFLGESVNPAVVVGTLTIAGGLYLVVTSQ